MSLLGGLPIVGPMLSSVGGSLPIIGGFFSDPAQAPPYSPQSSFSPQSFGGGSPWPSYGGGNPAPAFTGDQSKPGAGESYYAQNQGKWNPGNSAAQAWWDQNQGAFGGGGPGDQYWNGISGSGNTAPPKTTNYAADAYNQFQNTAPANTDPYYQNAARQADEQISKAYAARGMRGGSGEMDQLSEANQNLFAQQALQNAQYGLQRGQTAGQLGSGADASSIQGAQNKLGWMTGLGGLALGTQNADLQRLLGAGGLSQNVDQDTLAWLQGGMGAALGAQGAGMTRGQNYLENVMGATNAQTSPMIQAYMAMLQNDQNLINSGINASTGGALNNANMSSQNQAQNTQGLLGGLGAMAGISNAGGLSGILAGLL